MKKSIFTLLLFLVALSPLVAQDVLFPSPAATTLGNEEFIIGKKISVKGNGKYANQLARRIKSDLKTLDLKAEKSSGKISIMLCSQNPMDKEAYSILVDGNRIQLKAADEAGLYHAYEALKQMAIFGKGKIRHCEISSAPAYGWRGYMLDESRHFFGKEKVKQYIDLMAMLHLNVFHWHLTDEPGWRIEIKRYPKLTTEGAIGNWHDPKAPAKFYTQKDIKEIVAYAAERQIMIVPEFDMPGHATAICRSYPEISGGGEGKWQHFTFHPCKDETFEMISNIFDELFELFPSPYIHIGGDEVHFGNKSWYTDPLIQQFIKDHNLKNEVGMEHYFIRRIADMVADKGRTIIAWDEAINAGVSPDKLIVMWWRHDRTPQLEKALKAGYRIILAPRRPMYADFVQHDSHQVGRRWGGFNPIEDVYNFPAHLKPLLKGYEKQILGMQMNLWTERTATEKRIDFMTFPRMAALAEAAWNAEDKKDCKRFMEKLPQFLHYLDRFKIYYFNPFQPASTPEPPSPAKEDVLQNG